MWKFYIDAISENSGGISYYGDFATVNGWVILADDSYAFDVFWQDVHLGAVEPTGERKDVQRAFPDWPNSLFSGFNFALKLALVPVDKREGALLRFVVRKGDDVLEQAIYHLVKGEPQLELCIDGARFDDGIMQASAANFHLVGWMVADETILSIAAQVGEDVSTPVQFGIPRSDVLGIRPLNPNGLNTGFSLFIPQVPEGPGELRFLIELKGGWRIERSFAMNFAPGHDEVASTKGTSYPEQQFWKLLSERQPGETGDALWVVVVAPSSLADASDPVKSTLASLEKADGAGMRIVPLLDASFKKNLPAEGSKVEIFQNDEDLSAILRSLRRTTEGRVFVSFFEAGDTIDRAAPAQLNLALETENTFIYWDENASSDKPQTFRKTPGAPFITLFHTNFCGRGWAARLEDCDIATIASHGLRSVKASLPLDRFYHASERCRHIAQTMSHHAYDHDLVAMTFDDIEARRRFLQGIDTRYGVPTLQITGAGQETTIRLDVELARPPLVSIIIPTIGAQGKVFTCLQHLRERCSYKAIEIIVIDHMPFRPERVESKRRLAELADIVIPVTGPFNWSIFNNMGAAAASGDVFLFMNDDLEVVSEDFVEQLLAYINLPRIGVAGPRLLLPGGELVQSCGVSLMPEAGWARNDFAFSTAGTPLAEGVNLRPRNATSLLGAVIAVPKDLFLSLGGFEEAFPLTFNDLDFHMRVRRQNQQVVVIPHADLIHHEKSSRSELVESAMEPLYWERWHTAHAFGDPYWHPALEWDSGLYKVASEPVEVIWSTGVFGTRADVRHLLILRMDHVGDFTLTLPAFSQLRDAFPEAIIEVVVGGWNRELAEQSGLFDGVHVFNLYAARSGDGRALDSEGAARQFADLLGDRRYDLVVDMRADGDTRFLLMHVAASVKAGFSNNVSFPWLDVAIEWEGNISRYRKKANGAIQMQRLVSALELAYPRVAPASKSIWKRQGLPETPKTGPLRIVIHPFSGNEIKFWPARHWISLVSMIIGSGMSVEIIGTVAERQAKADLVESLVEIGAFDRIGVFTLPQLVGFIAQADCFVGADSGPKHIAASTGIPTVAVQSGFVDPITWSPFNALGVSLVKRLTCAPCYLDDVNLCPRNHDCMEKIYPRDVFRFLALLRADASPNAARHDVALEAC